MTVGVGETVDGRYRLIGELGEGGAGKVFLAEHVLIKRKVALKLLHEKYASDPEVVERFMNEARAAGTLGHPNIVESTDMGFARDQVPYITFEYLEGSSLTDEIYRLQGLPVRRALRIAYQIASALEAAHNANIIHRDLKSDNIFLTDRDNVSDHVKVLDFGVSRFLEEQNERSNKNQIFGTPEYMAPEQVTAPDKVDRRTDVYGLGVILYEMIAGRCPFRALDPSTVIHQVIHDAPPPLVVEGLPPGLPEMIFTKLLAKDPDQRYPTMKDVAGAIEAFHLIIPSSNRTPLSIPVPATAAEVAGQADAAQAPKPIPVAHVALPAAPRRSRAWVWLVLAVLAGGSGVAWKLTAKGTPAVQPNIGPQLEAEAKSLGSAIDSAVRAAHLRADGIAGTPMLRAGIETDAATLRDMAKGEFVFHPEGSEVFELFQVTDGTPVSLLQIPARGGPTHPMKDNGTLLEEIGGELRIIVGSPIRKQTTSDIGGVLVLSTTFDITTSRQAIGKLTSAARLGGLAKPFELVAGTLGGDAIAVKVPLATPNLPPLQLAAAPPAQTEGTKPDDRPALALWGISGIAFVIGALSLYRGRRQR